MDAVAEARAAIGEFTFEFPGLGTIRALRAPWFPGPRWWHVWPAIENGSWERWRDGLRLAVESRVKDWGGLTYEDIWRDPEDGMRFLRQLTRRT